MFGEYKWWKIIKKIDQCREYRAKNEYFDDIHDVLVGIVSQKLYNYQKVFLKNSLYSDNHIDIKEYNSNDGCALLEKLNQLSYQYGKEDLLSSLEVIASNPDDFSSDIPSLKKRIKYCKNPMERKSLERQLNDAYKAMKKRRW